MIDIGCNPLVLFSVIGVIAWHRLNVLVPNLERQICAYQSGEWCNITFIASYCLPRVRGWSLNNRTEIGDYLVGLNASLFEWLQIKICQKMRLVQWPNKYDQISVRIWPQIWQQQTLKLIHSSARGLERRIYVFTFWSLSGSRVWIPARMGN